MNQATKSESRLSRAAWLQHSLEILRNEGIQGVKINRLASDLGVTKGSFYWHFKDLADLHQSILEYWQQNYNESLHATQEFLEGDPAEGLLAAMTKVREAGLDRYELAMRAWSEHDMKVKKVVSAAYQSRIKFIGSFFRRMGFSGKDVEIRVRLLLCYMSWEPNLHPQEPKKRRLEMLKLQHQLLTQR
jgi:AcrR family transcriptional regulator